MKLFPLFAAFSLGLSLGSLRTSFDELKHESFIFGSRAEDDPLPIQDRTAGRKVALGKADEGLLDSELSSEDPITAWLGRYLTPVQD